MKLNKNSWHVGLNDYIYGHGYSHNMKNLCPYFWGTILAMIIVLPTAIIRSTDGMMSDGLKVFVSRYGLAIFWIGLGICLSMISGEVNAILYVGIGVFIFNLIMYGTGMIEKIGLYFYNRRKSKPYKEPKPRKERKPSMTVEMMKGWKNKHCPRVEWE